MRVMIKPLNFKWGRPKYGCPLVRLPAHRNSYCSDSLPVQTCDDALFAGEGSVCFKAANLALTHFFLYTRPPEAGSKAAGSRGAGSKDGGGGKAGACGSGDTSPLLKPGAGSGDGGRSEPVTRRPLALPCGHRFCEPCISQCERASPSHLPRALSEPAACSSVSRLQGQGPSDDGVLPATSVGSNSEGSRLRKTDPLQLCSRFVSLPSSCTFNQGLVPVPQVGGHQLQHSVPHLPQAHQR